jgi:hypothetical protein
MTEHRIDRQPEPEEPALAEVLQLRPYPRLGRIVGWAAPLVQGRGDVGVWPPPVPEPDDDDGPTAA